MFAVVEFTESQSVAVIPTTWFTGQEEETCVWPDGNSAKAAKFAKEEKQPSSSWKTYNIRVLGKAANYARAREKLAIAEEVSDLQTDTDELQPKRRRIRNKKFQSSDSSESESNDEEMPSPSRPPTTAFTEPPLPTLPAHPVSNTSCAPTTVPSQSASVPTIVSHKPSAPSRQLQPTALYDLYDLPSAPSRQSSSQSSKPSASFGPAASSSPSPSTSTPVRQLSTLSSTRTTPSCQSTVSLPRASNEFQKTHCGEDIMVRVFHLLEDIKETQRIHSSMLQALLRQSKETKAGPELPEGAAFPLNSLNEFDVMERKMVDPAFKSGVACVLGDLGGRNLTETVKRIMKYLMTTELALQFNLCGRLGKRAFGTSGLFDIVYRAVKKNPQMTECNKQEVERTVSKWLVGGRDRDGNRAKRAEKAKQKTQQVDN